MACRRNRHVMLSYQWNDKADVLQIYDALRSEGFDVWMDVKGGMRENLQASMADGVENAWVVVCFLSQAYQDSQNCQAEMTYAREQRKPIVPVKMESNWKPSGWLGITLAGTIYIKRPSSGLPSLITAITERLNMISSNQNLGDMGAEPATTPTTTATTTTILEDPQQFTVFGAYKKLNCEGRHCAKCGRCRDWYYTGESESWKWIQNVQNWKDSDWKRWRVDCVYKHFKKRDGAKCTNGFNDLRSLGGGADSSFHYSLNRGRGSGYFCLCDDNVRS